MILKDTLHKELIVKEKKSSDFKCPSSLCLPFPFISSTEIEVISTIKFPEDGISFMNISSPDSNFKLP